MNRSTAFGAGVVIGYSATKVLTSFELDYEACQMNVAEVTKFIKGDTMETIAQFDAEELRELSGSNMYYAHRVDLQAGLVNLATRSEGRGVPVKIQYNAEVVLYDPDVGTVTLEDGSMHGADLIIAADGVHSLAPGYLDNPDSLQLSHTGTTIIRFMLSSEDIQSDLITKHLAEIPGQFTFYIGPDRQRWLLQYPVRNNTEQNFGMYSLTNKDTAEDQALRFNGDRDSLRRELEGFHETIKGLSSKTSNILPIWKLVERPPLPTWRRGRLVLIGDAAHPMLPNQGMGAGSAIEDSGALGVIFSRMSSNTSEEAVEERLAVFERVRKGRASVIQLISHCPYFEDGVKIMWQELIKHMPAEKLPVSTGARTRDWLFSYDVLKDSQRALDDYLEVDASRPRL
jgi:salicylate hydroxylase